MKTVYIKNWFIFLMAVALVLLLVFLNSKGVFLWIKNIFFGLFSWFMHFLNQLADGIFDFWQSFIYTKNLKKENEKLKNVEAAILSQISRIKEMERENKLLKEKLEFFDTQNQILAQVRGFGDDMTSIIINQGKNKGALVNSPVVSKENIVVGKIVEAFPGFSKATLLNNPLSQVAVMTQEARARGILYGDGNKNYPVLKMVSREEEIRLGDKIITSGFDNIFPKGILIGEVFELKKDDLGIFQEAKIKPAVDFGGLEEVFVITLQ